MENLHNNTGLVAAIAAAAGGIAMWLIQLVAGRFLNDSFNLRREKIDELVNTIKKLEVTVSKVSDSLIVVQERYTAFSKELIDMKSDMKVMQKQLQDCQLKIAQEHK